MPVIHPNPCFPCNPCGGAADCTDPASLVYFDDFETDSLANYRICYFEEPLQDLIPPVIVGLPGPYDLSIIQGHVWNGAPQASLFTPGDAGPFTDDPDGNSGSASVVVNLPANWQCLRVWAYTVGGGRGSMGVAIQGVAFWGNVPGLVKHRKIPIDDNGCIYPNPTIFGGVEQHGITSFNGSIGGSSGGPEFIGLMGITVLRSGATEFTWGQKTLREIMEGWGTVDPPDDITTTLGNGTPATATQVRVGLVGLSGNIKFPEWGVNIA